MTYDGVSNIISGGSEAGSVGSCSSPSPVSRARLSLVNPAPVACGMGIGSSAAAYPVGNAAPACSAAMEWPSGQWNRDVPRTSLYEHLYAEGLREFHDTGPWTGVLRPSRGVMRGLRVMSPVSVDQLRLPSWHQFTRGTEMGSPLGTPKRCEIGLSSWEHLLFSPTKEQRLTSGVRPCSPDMIVVPGDSVDF